MTSPEVIGRIYLLSFTAQNIGLFLKIPLELHQLVLSFAILLNK